MLTLRSYEEMDAAATSRCFDRAVRTTASHDYTPAEVEAWLSGPTSLEWWNRRRLDTHTIVAEVDGAVVGFIDLDDDGYVDMLFVDPAVARTGVATALLARVTEQARAPALMTNASLTARPFFERHGFTVVAPQVVERDGVGIVNFRMRKPLATAGWLPAGFEHPLRVEWRDGVHLRPIAASDVDIDYPAVMGDRDELWARYGEAWGWPPETMTPQQDAEDLSRHADEMVTHESFNYAILPADESRLYGCLYLDPLPGHPSPPLEAEASWWLVRDAPAELHADLDAFAHRWLATAWPFTRVHTPLERQ
jgi:GNAT superfamily N-acetyltransferase